MDDERTRVPAVVWRAIAALLVLGGLWALTALPTAVTVPTDPVPAEQFDPALLDRIAERVRPGRLLAPIAILLRLGIPLAFVLTPPGRRLVARVADGVGARRPVRAGVGVALAIALAVELAVLPLAFWTGHVIESRFGFRTSGALDWLRDRALAVGIEMLILAAGVALVVWIVGRWPRTWHLRVAALGAIGTAAGSFIWPVLVTPLFLTATPLEPGPLRDRIEAAAVASGFDDVRIEVVDASRRTTRANAFVTGFGGSTRIQLYDNLVTDDADEVLVVVAHELAHVRHDDVLHATLLAMAGLVPGTWLLRRVLEDARVVRGVGATRRNGPRLVAVAVATVTVLEFALTPIGLAVSRRVELAADVEALRTTRDPDAHVALFRRFVEEDLASPTQPAWVVVLYGSHPQLRDRIRLAATWEAGAEEGPS